MKEVTISEGVKTIDEYAFSGSTLRKITIHAFLDYIEYRAFYQCKLLEEFTVKGGVKKIGSSVFVEDTYLTRVTLPNDLVSIGDYAFYNLPTKYRLTVFSRFNWFKSFLLDGGGKRVHT